MQVFLICALASLVAALDSSLFAQFLLLDRYGNNNRHNRRHCRWIAEARRFRCQRRDDDNTLEFLALYKSLLPKPTPTPSPPTCYPDYATLDRLLPSGEYETIPIKALTAGDQVKCLKAPLGPYSENLEVGACRYVSKNHDEDIPSEYIQIFYQDSNKETKMLALSPTHMLWSSSDTSLMGVVEPSSISVANNLLVQARTVKVGDVLAVLDQNNAFTYRPVTEIRTETMQGVHNPGFSDGGLPIVNGVLSTTSASGSVGGHWGSFLKKIWFEDSKFENATEKHAEYKRDPLRLAEIEGRFVVDNENCVFPRVVEDIKNGIDVKRFTSYTEFGLVYIIPCGKFVIPEDQTLA